MKKNIPLTPYEQSIADSTDGSLGRCIRPSYLPTVEEAIAAKARAKLKCLKLEAQRQVNDIFLREFEKTIWHILLVIANLLLAANTITYCYLFL